MRLQTLLGLLAATALVLPLSAAANPPAHAPAHGYRAKHKAPKVALPSGGVEVIFDSERGIHVAIGLPGVIFRDGHYYREHDGQWQISLSGNGGWRVSATSEIPDAVVKARKIPHRGPAKMKGKKHK